MLEHNPLLLPFLPTANNPTLISIQQNQHISDSIPKIAILNSTNSQHIDNHRTSIKTMECLRIGFSKFGLDEEIEGFGGFAGIAIFEGEVFGVPVLLLLLLLLWVGLGF